MPTSLELEEIAKTFDVYEKDISDEVKQYNDLYSKYEELYQYDEKYKIPEVKVVNIVISTLVEKMEVERIKNDLRTEYYPRQFPGYIFRLANPKSAILFFKTGKVICTGIKNIQDAHKALRIFCNRFKIPEVEKIDIQNLVISVDFKYYLDLEEAANKVPRAIYESEQFPGIIYRNQTPKAVFLLFTSGKCICVGTNKLEDAFEAVFFLRDILINGNLLINDE